MCKHSNSPVSYYTAMLCGLGFATLIPSAHAAVESIAGSSPELCAATSLDGNTVRTVVRDHNAAMKECYLAALQTNPQENGDWVTSFSVLANGNVTNAQVVEKSIQSETFSTCLLGVISNLHFPASECPDQPKW